MQRLLSNDKKLAQTDLQLRQLINKRIEQLEKNDLAWNEIKAEKDETEMYCFLHTNLRLSAANASDYETISQHVIRKIRARLF